MVINKIIYCKECDKEVEYCTDYVGNKHSLVKFCNICDVRIEEEYKFCILAAGKGTRNTTVEGLHKALLPLENKAVISRIIQSIPNNIEIVIALGYKGEQVRSYVEEVFPRRDFTFVTVENYDGPGSGPGLSLLECKKHLQTPFIFTSADTLIEEDFIFESLKENWIGTSHVKMEDSLKYCLVKGSKYLDKLYYGTGNRAYIGLAGIYDYKSYWKSLEEHNIIKDEYQVIHGFDGLDKIKLVDLTWYDTGNNQSYLETRKSFTNEAVAIKNKEALFIDNGKVIKYYDTKDKALKRIKRTKYLNNCSPQVKALNDNMYSYEHIDGKMLSNVYDEKTLKKCLDFFYETFGKKSYTKTSKFKDNCKSMYEKKTFSRIKVFEDSSIDKIKYINGVEVKPIREMLNLLDWEKIYTNAIPARFHGDYQPENIIYTGKKFSLIDWRESFGDDLEIGDLYYDLGKLHHALIINGQEVLKKNYNYEINGDNCTVNYTIKSNLLTLLEYFEEFCKEKKYSWDNVEILSILQYISISSLYPEFHNGDYGRFLFLLGKYQLAKKLNN
tara:strand:- start:3897 stop:5561 length:1665 start_codon:yes stop_codon:yes gene_type:complete